MKISKITILMLIYAAFSFFGIYVARSLQGPKGCTEILSRKDYEQCQKWHGHQMAPYLGDLPEIIKPVMPEKLFIAASKRYSTGGLLGILYLGCGMLFLFPLPKLFQGLIFLPILFFHLLIAFGNYQYGYLNYFDFIIPIGLLFLFIKKKKIKSTQHLYGVR